MPTWVWYAVLIRFNIYRWRKRKSYHTHPWGLLYSAHKTQCTQRVPVTITTIHAELLVILLIPRTRKLPLQRSIEDISKYRRSPIRCCLQRRNFRGGGVSGPHNTITSQVTKLKLYTKEDMLQSSEKKQ